MFESENIDTRQLATVAIFGVTLIPVVIIGLQVLFFRMEKQDRAKFSGQRPAELANMLTEQATELATYDWVDKTAGVAKVPIKRAMQLELEDLVAHRR